MNIKIRLAGVGFLVTLGLVGACGSDEDDGAASGGVPDSGTQGGTGGSSSGGTSSGTGGTSAGGKGTGGVSTGGASTGGASTGGSAGALGGAAGMAGASGGAGGSAGSAGGAAGIAGAPGGATSVSECSRNVDCTTPEICHGGNCIACSTTLCETHGPYACGDCTDNDGDGLTDMADPDCLGPCHDKENGYMGCVPGQGNQACLNDCYFDIDSGSGNDGCNWHHSCDPYDTSGAEGDRCPYTCDSCVGDKATCIQSCNDTLASMPGTCAQVYTSQPALCASYCGPLTPNGCDCFGCCELPSGSGQYVFLGSTSDLSRQCEMGTCTKEAAAAGDLTACRPCTPVAACLNTCEPCECCLGKDCSTLPSDCRRAGDPLGCVSPQCPQGVQACGVACTDACPQGQFCNTGCCRPVPP